MILLAVIIGVCLTRLTVGDETPPDPEILCNSCVFAHAGDWEAGGDSPGVRTGVAALLSALEQGRRGECRPGIYNNTATLSCPGYCSRDDVLFKLKTEEGGRIILRLFSRGCRQSLEYSEGYTAQCTSLEQDPPGVRAGLQQELATMGLFSLEVEEVAYGEFCTCATDACNGAEFDDLIETLEVPTSHFSGSGLDGRLFLEEEEPPFTCVSCMDTSFVGGEENCEVFGTQDEASCRGAGGDSGAEYPGTSGDRSNISRVCPEEMCGSAEIALDIMTPDNEHIAMSILKRGCLSDLDLETIENFPIVPGRCYKNEEFLPVLETSLIEPVVYLSLLGLQAEVRSAELCTCDSRDCNTANFDDVITGIHAGINGANQPTGPATITSMIYFALILASHLLVL